MKKIIIAFVLFITVLLYSKELHLSVKEKLICIDSSKEKKLDKNEEFNQKICLGDGYFYILKEEVKTLYDFKNKKTYHIDLKNQSYTEYSLYSEIGFRSAELQNRIWMKDFLEKAGMEKNPYDILFNQEIVFSIENPKISEPPIIEKISGNELVYKIKNKIYTKYTLLPDKKVDSYRDMFEKYLLYNCGIHPKIRKKILEKNLFFHRLYFKILDDITAYDITIDLENSVETNEDFNAIPESFKKTVDSDEEIFKMISAAELTPPKHTTKNEYKELVSSSMNNKNYFEALLIGVECLLENDESFTEELKKILPYSQEDKNLLLYIKAQGLSNEKKYEEALNTYNSISRENLKRDYNIDIQIAAMYLYLNKYKEAEEYYLKALRKNPYITSVYKDLGDIYYNSYQMSYAWLIWDFAKKISPDHSILNGIYELEKNLEKYYPEYF